MRLRDALSTLTLDDLRQLALTLNLPLPHYPTRLDVIDVIVRHLVRADVITATLASLDSRERAALEELAAHGGVMPLQLFERDYGMLLHIRPHAVDGPLPPRTTTTPATNLFHTGLVFPSYGKLDGWEGEIAIVPEEILAHLPKARGARFADSLEPAPEPAVRDPQPDLVRDLGMLLCYLQRETVRAVRGDQFPKRDLARLNADMSIVADMTAVRVEADAQWIAFVHHCARKLGLMHVQGGLLTPTEKADSWLALSLEKRTWDAWRAVLRDTTWNEIERSVDDAYSYGFSTQQTLLAAREQTLAALKECLPLRWYTVASFCQAMKLHRPFFLRARGGSMASVYWDRMSFYGSWRRIEEPLLAYLLENTLTAFNVVETGRTSARDGQRVFRLTARGTLLLGVITGAIDEPAAPPIVVQPNFEIIVPRETPPGTIYRLQAFARLQKSDQASIYTLSPQSLWPYLQSGGNVQAALQFLESASGRPVPQNVAYSLTEWAARHGEVVIERVDLLRTQSDALMAELRASRKLSLPVADEISPRAVTLRDADLAALADALRKAGYWPKVGQGASDVAPTIDSSQLAVTIGSHDLVALLAAAIALSGIMRKRGRPSPLSDRTLDRLLKILPPSLERQVRKAARQALTDYGLHPVQHARDSVSANDAVGAPDEIGRF